MRRGPSSAQPMHPMRHKRRSGPVDVSNICHSPLPFGLRSLLFVCFCLFLFVFVCFVCFCLFLFVCFFFERVGTLHGGVWRLTGAYHSVALDSRQRFWVALGGFADLSYFIFFSLRF